MLRYEFLRHSEKKNNNNGPCIIILSCHFHKFEGNIHCYVLIVSLNCFSFYYYIIGTMGIVVKIVVIIVVKSIYVKY